MIKTKGPRPMCRWCGRDLRKRTTTYWVIRDPDAYKWPERHRHLQGPIQTWAEAQRSVNDGTVISVVYSRPDHVGGLRSFNVWDGESYEASNGFFCTNNCAMDMGRAAARQHPTSGGPGYVKRIAELRQKQSEDAR